MGIFDALTTSVGGLQAQSFALQNISGNIANASTIGYKGIGTSFEDLIPDATTPNRQVAGGVTAFAQATITTQGTVSASTVATNMAINGDGFFSVQAATGTVDNSPVFNGVTDYTRRGDFQVNANGNLVNGAGYYLMGVAVDPKTGNPLGNVPQVLQFQNNFIPAQATSAIQYAANLPTVPATTASSTSGKGTLGAAGGLVSSDFTQNPSIAGTPPAPFSDNNVTGSAALIKPGVSTGTAGPITANTALSSVAVDTATGSAINNQNAAVITSATKLTGAAGSDSLGTTFAAGNSINVNGKIITFSTSATSTSATGGNIDVTTGTVGDVLAAIDQISGTTNASTINPTTGAITLNDNVGSLSITGSPSGAMAALGFSGPIAPPANSLTTSFTTSDVLTVDGASVNQQIAFYNSAAGGTAGTTANTTYLDLATATVGDLLNDIDTITGNPPGTSTINATTGAITLHTGTANDLSVATNNTAANSGFTALGFGTTMTAKRIGGGTTGTGFVIGNDLTTFTNETISGGAITGFNSAGTPVNVQLRWAKTDSENRQRLARCRASRHLESVLSDRSLGHRQPGRLGQRRYQLRIQLRWIAIEPGGLRRYHPGPDRQRSITRQRHVQPQRRRPDAICVNGRHRDHQYHHAERLCRRPASVGGYQQQRPRGRYLLQRAEYRSRRRHALAFRRHQLSEGARRRCVCGHRSVRSGDRRRVGIDQRFVARRIEHRHRRRVHQADRDPASLFGEHKSYHHGQRHGSELAERNTLIGLERGGCNVIQSGQ
jgi:flagellar hook protein FlgE